MQYFSTRNKNHAFTFSEAVLLGLAPDGGLFMPEYIPKLNQDITTLTKEEIAYSILSPFVGDEILSEDLRKIIHEAFNFDCPLAMIQPHVYGLQLYHGPTLAFKDFGARFMARVMSYFAQKQNIAKVKIIAATSGDTGSAVASGFYNVPNTEVYILYPSKKVSHLQEQQLTTWHGNIKALEVAGTFDDCQAIAKKILSNKKDDAWYTSANSINISRLLPQMLYYALAYQELKSPITFCVPSGNFGNLTAGIFAQQMGLPFQFIAACNANDSVVRYLKSEAYEPKPSIATISNAMDVGAPSNFERMSSLLSFEQMKNLIKAYSFSDDETSAKLREVYQTHQYLLDPHSAVGMLGIEKHFSEGNYVLLETAHPAKFQDTVEKITKHKLTLPGALENVLRKKKESIYCTADEAVGIVMG